MPAQLFRTSSRMHFESGILSLTKINLCHLSFKPWGTQELSLIDPDGHRVLLSSLSSLLPVNYGGSSSSTDSSSGGETSTPPASATRLQLDTGNRGGASSSNSSTASGSQQSFVSYSSRSADGSGSGTGYPHNLSPVIQSAMGSPAMATQAPWK